MLQNNSSHKNSNIWKILHPYRKRPRKPFNSVEQTLHTKLLLVHTFIGFFLKTGKHTDGANWNTRSTRLQGKAKVHQISAPVHWKFSPTSSSKWSDVAAVETLISINATRKDTPHVVYDEGERVRPKALVGEHNKRRRMKLNVPTIDCLEVWNVVHPVSQRSDGWITQVTVFFPTEVICGKWKMAPFVQGGIIFLLVPN